MNGCLQGNILQYYPKMGTIDPYLHIFGAYSGNFDQTFFWKIECPTFAWGAPTTLGITLIDALNLSRLVPSICSFLHYTDWLCWLCFGLTKKKSHKTALQYVYFTVVLVKKIMLPAKQPVNHYWYFERSVFWGVCFAWYQRIKGTLKNLMKLKWSLLAPCNHIIINLRSTLVHGFPHFGQLHWFPDPLPVLSLPSLLEE